MEKITFDQLPAAVANLTKKIDFLTDLLTAKATSLTLPQAVESSDLLIIKQAAEFVNLAIPTIYGLVGRGQIPYMKKGKKLYFSKKELLAWVAEGRRATVAEIKNDVIRDLVVQKKCPEKGRRKSKPG